MLTEFNTLLSNNALIADAGQLAVAERLQQLTDQLLQFKQARKRKLLRMINPPQLPRGLYIWGSVGRGKTMLMDCFFRYLNYRRKRRIHFHEFMREIHQSISQLKGVNDPLGQISREIAKTTRVLCFDEFHVSDIADAMLLGRLLECLFAQGVVIIITSNYQPSALYPDGLKRDHFLPTIDLIEKEMDVVELDSTMDFRRRNLTHIELYHTPLDDLAETKIVHYCQAQAPLADEPSTLPPSGTHDLLVNNRRLAYRWKNDHILWCDFEQLCGGHYSQNDYLALAQQYDTVIITGIPKLLSSHSDVARRFTWLVDVFYDQHIKLIITAAVDVEQLYTEGRQAGEFGRTVSRLIEMQSEEYFEQ